MCRNNRKFNYKMIKLVKKNKELLEKVNQVIIWQKKMKQIK